jgi:hypothetical protein
MTPERIAQLRDMAIRLHETRVLECLDAIEELLKRKECQCQK